MTFSRADSRVKVWRFSDVSGANYVPSSYRSGVKMGTELVPEMSEKLNILTRLSARENSIEFCGRENFNK